MAEEGLEELGIVSFILHIESDNRSMPLICILRYASDTEHLGSLGWHRACRGGGM